MTENKVAERIERGRSLYGTSAADSGSLDLSLNNYYTRRHAAVRDDPERLEQSRTERKQLETFARSRNISPSTLQTNLSTLRDHELTHERRTFRGEASAPQETLVQNAFETLRLEEGSEANAVALWQRAQRGASVVEKAVPTLAKRAAESGALVNPQILRFLASVADEPEQVQK